MPVKRMSRRTSKTKGRKSSKKMSKKMSKLSGGARRRSSKKSSKRKSKKSGRKMKGGNPDPPAFRERLGAMDPDYLLNIYNKEIKKTHPFSPSEHGNFEDYVKQYIVSKAEKMKIKTEQDAKKAALAELSATSEPRYASDKASFAYNAMLERINK